MATWFTSDLHFGHARLLELDPARGEAFGNVDAMNMKLIANWNAVVSPEDTVFVLGDVSMHGKNLHYLDYLVGEKVLVNGNHDSSWSGAKNGWKHQATYLEHFDVVTDFVHTTLPPRKKNAPRLPVVLSHFPYDGDHTDGDRFEQYRLRDEGTVLIHGHVHKLFRERKSKRGTWMVNVGVDVWNWTPVHEDELAKHVYSLMG